MRVDYEGEMSAHEYPGKVSKNVARFVIDDFTVTPEQIESCLGVKPTKVILKGTRSNPRASPAPTNTWVLESDEDNRQDTEEQIQNLLKKLKNFRQLRNLDPKISVHISCVIYFIGDDNRPTISLTPEIMRALVEMNCYFGVDYYLF